jgi:diguanylate cyclase (GGDEF)-like protein
MDKLRTLRYELEHDPLTGLWNRSHFRTLARAAIRPGTSAAVAVIDLVDFYAVNELGGYLAGDALLVDASVALLGHARSEEIVARVGGDSFAICFPGTGSLDQVRERVARFGALFERPIGSREEPTGVAIGLASAPADGTSLAELLFRAEARADVRTANRNRLLFPPER